MSGGVDEHAPPTTRDSADRSLADQIDEHQIDKHQIDEHQLDEHLVQPDEDRWAWRRRIRANPHQLRVYRGAVGALGLLLILLGLATGWLPGPGGIPLVLGGLAVWASEFRWAHRLMLRLKHALHVFRGWSGRRKALFWLLLVVGCGLVGWASLALVGPPAWIPAQVDRVLAVLPGVDIPA